MRMSLALAYLRPDIAADSVLQVMVLGRPHQARVLATAAFDPAGARLRALTGVVARSMRRAADMRG